MGLVDVEEERWRERAFCSEVRDSRLRAMPAPD